MGLRQTHKVPFPPFFPSFRYIAEGGFFFNSILSYFWNVLDFSLSLLCPLHKASLSTSRQAVYNLLAIASLGAPDPLNDEHTNGDPLSPSHSYYLFTYRSKDRHFMGHFYPSIHCTIS